MGKYMKNESLDVVVAAIVDEEISAYKGKLQDAILQHFENPYCASTDIGKVMYKKEVMDIIEKIR